VVVAVGGPRDPLAGGDRVDGGSAAVGDLRDDGDQGRDDHRDEQERAQVLGGGLAALTAQPGEDQRDVGEEPCPGERAGGDGDELEQRAGRVDGVRDRQREADQRAHRAGAGGAHQDDLAPVAGAGQGRLPCARDAAEGGGDEDEQEPGADLRHLGLDGVEHPDETAQQDEQREQRGRDADGGRPRDRAHSCCSQDLHIAEASQRCGARREAQDPTWSWAGPGLAPSGWS
jgi:hypothetical protein